MLDIKFIRENIDFVKAAIESKNEKNKVDELIKLDTKRREILAEVESLKAERNSASKEVGNLKKQGKDATEIVNKMAEVGEKIKELDNQLRNVENELNEKLLWIPNIPHSSVPKGKDSSENVEVRSWIPENMQIKKDFPTLDHIELGKKLGILDFDRGAKISGSGFGVYVGKGAMLERALINFMLDFHIQNHGYTEIIPPLFVNEDSMIGTGQIPKMREDMYFIEKDGLYAIPTAEVPITNLHRDEILKDEELPKFYVGYTACFRREAGSYGKDSKGFLRTHQFNKVEMVKIVKPETSYEELEKITNDAEDILKALKIPYRVLMLCTGDLSFSAAKCYDIETWSPAENKYLEASSCSNFEDFQARRLKLRFRDKEDGKMKFVHTLNGSGLATSRLMVSLLENNQTADGKILVPEVLQKYTGFSVIE